MSIRFAASSEEIQEAERIYAILGRQRTTGKKALRLHAGRVRYTGWRDLLDWRRRLTLTQRLSTAVSTLCLLGIGTRLLHAPFDSLPAQAAVLIVGAAITLTWFHVRFSKAISEADAFAGDLASCNLTTSIDLNHFNPLGSLIRRLWQVQINMRAIISDVRTEVESTTAAITDIAEGTIGLSQRTDEQASSLQQTAASMEHLASTVKQSAAAAREASVYTESSNDVAQRGSLAIEDVGKTIAQIESSSTTVKSIVSVIEEISFQTNILALNAAVEAARAGEHGRGFAVVAAEVRSLAQRSAGAAKQIRELINNSSLQVTSGTRRVVAATETIQETLTAVTRIGQMVAQISLASQDQSAGIAQINEAITHLDSVTQHNASMAQQTASATEALQRRTTTLRRSVQVFRLQNLEHTKLAMPGT